MTDHQTIYRASEGARNETLRIWQIGRIVTNAGHWSRFVTAASYLVMAFGMVCSSLVTQVHLLTTLRDKTHLFLQPPLGQQGPIAAQLLNQYEIHIQQETV